MQELIKRGNVFIAQPPLYRIKKGKFEQYIKNDNEFVRVMVKRAADGIVVRYGEGAATLEGAPLTKFMTTLNEYIGFVDKVNKRIRDEVHHRNAAALRSWPSAPTSKVKATARRRRSSTLRRR